jgi:hypothetical protein
MHLNFVTQRNWSDSTDYVWSGKFLCRLFTAEAKKEKERENKIIEVMVIQEDRHASIETDHGLEGGALFKDHAEKTKLTR